MEMRLRAVQWGPSCNCEETFKKNLNKGILFSLLITRGMGGGRGRGEFGGCCEYHKITKVHDYIKDNVLTACMPNPGVHPYV